ncbi:MAG: MscS family rane protein [Thermodesulfobacteriota bacterium]|nr:MscS family rane protein [Thermodesulfobacteriota bacterium]
MRKHAWMLTTVTILLCVLGGMSFAEPVTPYPLEPLDTSSPRATLQSLIDSSREAAAAYLKGDRKDARASARRAMECLDLEQELPDLREALGLESMLYLLEVLHRIDLPPMETVPDKEDVQERKIKSWTIPHTPITIGIGTEGVSNGKFLFTPETIRLLPELYKTVKDLPYKWGMERFDIYRDLTSHGGLIFSRRIISLLPDFFSAFFFGLRLWQWVGLALYVSLATVITLAGYVYVRRGLGRLDRRYEWNLRHNVGGLILPVALIVFPKIGLWVLIYGLHILNVEIYRPAAFVLVLLLYIGAIWLIGAILNRLSSVVISLGHFARGGMDTQLIRLGFQIVTLIITAVLAIDFGARLGMPTYSMVTGLGISGLAVALAGREALSNLIGTVMIIFDQPFKPGDFIVVGEGDQGTVTEVGFRSTRIRTRDGILISIPNSTVANMKIVNMSAPVTVTRIHVPVGAAYGSDPREVEDALLTVCKQSEYVTTDPAPSIRLIGFGDSSINFSLLCWVHHPEMRGRALDQLNRAIHEEFGRRGIVMPFPQRDVHIVSSQDPRNDLDTRSLKPSSPA